MPPLTEGGRRGPEDVKHPIARREAQGAAAAAVCRADTPGAHQRGHPVTSYILLESSASSILATCSQQPVILGIPTDPQQPGTRAMLKNRIILSFFLFFLPLAAAEATDVSFVDMQQVIEKSKLGSKVQEQLRKEFEPKAKPLGEEEQAIKQLQAGLAREAALMSKDQLAKKEAELKKRIEAFEKTAAPFQQELLKAQQERGREVLISAQKAVEVVAKQKKIGMVVERSLQGIIYMDKAADITDEVVKQMDASAK